MIPDQDARRARQERDHAPPPRLRPRYPPPGPGTSCSLLARNGRPHPDFAGRCLREGAGNEHRSGGQEVTRNPLCHKAFRGAATESQPDVEG